MDSKARKTKIQKWAYITWEDNEASSSSHSKNEEQTHISLMTSHHSDGENDEVCDSNDKPSYEELQSAKAF